MENYKILNPGGNKTALVKDENYTKEQKKMINNQILKENPEVEQVGFISQSENNLQMAGGEFCVNATRCAIWEYLKGKCGQIELTVSGYQGKIIGGIDERRNVYVNLKMDKKMNDILEKNGIFNFVKLDGIFLAVVSEEDSKAYLENLRKDENRVKNELKEIMKTFSAWENAVGVILLEKENFKTKINPIIWVKTIDTLYYETACGSGSLATAIYKNDLEEIENLEILQPSGFWLEISLKKEQEMIRNARISGKVMEG